MQERAAADEVAADEVAVEDSVADEVAVGDSVAGDLVAEEASLSIHSCNLISRINNRIRVEADMVIMVAGDTCRQTRARGSDLTKMTPLRAIRGLLSRCSSQPAPSILASRVEKI